MKDWNKVIGYRLRMYSKTSKMMVPLLVFLSFTYIAYSNKPNVFMDDAKLSAVMAGYTMMWIAYTYFSEEDSAVESILYCALNRNKVKYYGSRLLALLVIGIGLSLIGAVYPFIVNVANGGAMFDRAITPWDFAGSFLLHMILTMVFIAAAQLFQPRLIRNRKVSILCIVLVAVLSICKSKIIESYGMTRYFLYILPPVNDITGEFYGQDFFAVHSVLTAFLYGILYSSAVLAAGQILLSRKEF